MIPKFIVIEGLDGAGKSTAIDTIKKFFYEKKIVNVKYTREPGGTPIAEKIRELALIDDKSEKISSDTELLLMYASRLQHVNSLIKPALNNKIVVSDRFYWSSLAYQGGGRELGFSKINSLNNIFLSDCKPDLTIYLDIEPSIGLTRAGKVGSPDRIEKAGLEFFNRTRQAFKELVEKDENAFEVNSNQSIENVKKDIIDILNKYYK